MQRKMELHREVAWFVRHQCNDKEVDAFYEALDRVRDDPIGASEAMADADLSRYMLRFFRFENCIAIFETNRSRDRLRVRQCRRLPPKRGKPPNAPDE